MESRKISPHKSSCDLVSRDDENSFEEAISYESSRGDLGYINDKEVVKVGKLRLDLDKINKASEPDINYNRGNSQGLLGNLTGSSGDIVVYLDSSGEASPVKVFTQDSTSLSSRKNIQLPLVERRRPNNEMFQTR